MSVLVVIVVLVVLLRIQTSIKNLGVYLDSKMSFDKQVSETCKACYFHIRALRHIRASLTTEASKTIAAAIVGSRLDFCNSLLAGTSVSNPTHLQLLPLRRTETPCHPSKSVPSERLRIVEVINFA